MSGTQNIQMLEVVAQALGQDLCQEVAFVGGCTTALLLTDEFSREEVRYTDDVDLVIPLTGHIQWQKLVENLQQKGFKQSQQDEVICRMRLGILRTSPIGIEKHKEHEDRKIVWQIARAVAPIPRRIRTVCWTRPIARLSTAKPRHEPRFSIHFG